MRTTSRKVLMAGAIAMVVAVSGCAGSRVAAEKKTDTAQTQGAPASGGAGPGSAASGGGSGGGPANTKMIAELHIPSEADASVGNLVNYNPYSPKPLTGTWLFEPLMIQNGMSCEVVPWLATAYKWDGNKLTFTIRDGVKWSDGQPFTSKDVAFTFNLGKKYSSIDRAGVWSTTFGAPAKSVTASGNQVTLEFTGNAAAKFPAIVSMQTLMLPEHVYSKVGDPAKFIDKNPVSTGAFKVGSYNGRRLELVRRDDYWQADKVKVQKLVLEGTYEAPQASAKLSAGDLDAYWGEIPNPAKTFVSKDPSKNHFWYAANGITVLSPNLTKAPFNDPQFREAISYAMDKQQISLKATYGIMQPASQSGLKLPIMAKMLPDQYSTSQGAATVLPFDTAKAGQLLDTAGYPKGGDGVRTNKDGSPLSVDFSIQAGFIDYQAIADVVVSGLKTIGLNAKVTASSPDAVDQAKKSGDFQLVLEYLHGGCDFARGLGAKLATDQIPTKTTILPNVERFSDKATDADVAALGAAIDDAARKPLVGKLVDTMMTQFPVTSLIYAPARILYRTDHAVGWPTEQDPYAHPVDDKLIILTHLTAP